MRRPTVTRGSRKVLDVDQLKARLVESGRISSDRLAEADRHATEKRVSLSEALTSSLMLGFSDLGQCCSEVTGLPYVPLLPDAPSAAAMQGASSQC